MSRVFNLGPVRPDKSTIGLGNVDNTSDANKPVSTAQQAALDGKVDKISGKGLSTNDYTDADKAKVTGIEEGANKSTLLSFTTHFISPLWGYEDPITVLDADFYAEAGAVIGVQVDIPRASAQSNQFEYQDRLAMLSQVQVAVQLFYDNSNSALKTWERQFDSGDHGLNLSYPFTVDSDGNHNLKLKVSCKRGYFSINYPYPTMLLSGAKAATA